MMGKTGELSQQLRDLIVAKHTDGIGYKRISRLLEVPVTTVGAIIRKWKKHHLTVNRPRSGAPRKFSDGKGKKMSRKVEELRTTCGELQEDTESTEPYSMIMTPAGPDPSRLSSFIESPSKTLLKDSQRMDKEISRSIIDIALEIICVLSGEDYTVVRTTPGNLNQIPKPSPTSLIPERREKILELTSKITELLTEEETAGRLYSTSYHAGHQDVMMEDWRLFLSHDGSWRRNQPEGCSTLYSQDCPEENHRGEDLIHEEGKTDFMAEQQYGLSVRNPTERCPAPLYPPERCPAPLYPPERCPAPLYSKDCLEDHQGRDLTIIKVEGEEEQMMDDQPCMSDVKEEIPDDDPAEDSRRNMLSVNCKIEDEDVLQNSSEENRLTLNIHPKPHGTDLSHHSTPRGPFPDPSQIVTTSTSQDHIQGFQCGECGKQFAKRASLSIHQKSHLRKKPFFCTECEKYFTYKSSFIKHQRSHTGEKPYSCSQCGKCFTNRSQLVTHERSHTGVTPY
ncbi:uncharacterized protein ACNLHF_013837 isoform 1-T2 [Anomaloglossus baeobatrachus]|uniref:uncharacterized protein LOC142297108 n=1 Tax=Anomaloglossus baeobatrachus TaxID=238106 RepID=UPI003F4F6AA1